MFRFGPAVIAALPLFACKASVEGKVNAGGNAEMADFDTPIGRSMTTSGASPGDRSRDLALFGARQDLSFRGPSTAACRCLEVALGQPGDRPFQWAGERPRTEGDSQLVFAMSSNGVACPGGGEKLTGASYWGYEVVGSDVVVVVERAAAGRPVASGAIIPRPAGNGQVYVRPADPSIPYGRPLTAAVAVPGKASAIDRCQIGKLTPVTPAAPAQPLRTGDEPSP